jgi:hypothetical protein
MARRVAHSASSARLTLLQLHAIDRSEMAMPVDHVTGKSRRARNQCDNQMGNSRENRK